MRKLLIFLFIVTFLFSCKTKIAAPLSVSVSVSNVKIQTKEINRNSFVLETEKDFDTIDKNYIIYIKMNHGSRKSNLDCDSSEIEEKYILFKKEDSSYIQKVVDVAVYYPTPLKSNHIINSYINLFSELKNERIKNFRTMQKSQILGLHSIHKNYIFVVEQNHPVTISFPEYDFKKDYADEKNASYEYNKNLKLFKIDSLLNSEIDELNRQNAFRFRKCRKN
ncbi:hypothetical protein [Chryseobacterium caseinilyticum]|uniref:Lipoprotein n=1 Tax=Chryseobacterium caseinilyticum TaxID=2771428 RepID=A0ABR8ZCD6_9FLAO|nr:hypothetical protein [Chryseobacterium caseinilyticum]MBD8082905.1 hypothetical protein [Chryseobacterium caseinilyticum]